MKDRQKELRHKYIPKEHLDNIIVVHIMRLLVPKAKIALSQVNPTRVEIVYAGGTISSFATAEGYKAGGQKVELFQLLKKKFPDSLKNIIVTGQSFAYLGLSENLDFEYWEHILFCVEKALLRKPDVVIITHGTDSMEQTARYLQKCVQKTLTAQNTSIVLTGAIEDIKHPNTDAWNNLQLAINSGKRGLKPGVYVAFHDLVIQAADVIKEPFDGIIMNYASAKSSRYKSLAQAQKKQDTELIKALRKKFATEKQHPQYVLEYPVNRIVQSHAPLLMHFPPQVKAVVLTLYHSGTANTENGATSIAALVEHLRTRRKTVCFAVTETGEPVNLHAYETSLALRKAGLVPLYDIRKDVALEKLRFLADKTPRDMIRGMLTNSVGELQESIYEDDVKALIKLYTSK